MSYVEADLLTGETIAYQTRLHWKIYILPATAAVCLLVLSAALLRVTETKVVSIGLAAVASIVLAAAYLTRRSSEFAVTNKRVIVKLGLFHTRSLELFLGKIEGIAVNQGLSGRLFNYGDIVITGSGGTKETFSGIQGPLSFRRAVQQATDQGG